MPVLIPKSVNSNTNAGTVITRLYCPYKSAFNSLPTIIAATAIITVAKAEPEKRKNPPLAESSVTFDKSSGKTTTPPHTFANPQIRQDQHSERKKTELDK